MLLFNFKRFKMKEKKLKKMESQISTDLNGSGSSMNMKNFQTQQSFLSTESTTQDETVKNKSFFKNPDSKSKTAKKYQKSFKQRKDSINVIDVSFLGTHNLNEITDRLASEFDENIQENNNEQNHEKDQDHLVKKSERVCCTSLTKGKHFR